MKQIRVKLYCLVVFLSVVMSFTSCDNDDTEVVFEALPEVLIKGKKVGDVEKYAVEYEVYATKNIKSVTVKTPGTESKTVTLVKVFGNYFTYIPLETEFVETLPAIGDYEFTVTSLDDSDQPLVVKNKLEDVKLSQVAIKESVFDNNDQKVAWDLVTGTDTYRVKLYKDNVLIFQGNYLKNTVKEYSFNAYTPGWLNAVANVGEEYELELCAFKFETGVTAYQLSHIQHVQFISVDRKTIKWGQTN